MIGLVTCARARGYDTDLPLLLEHLPEARIVDWHDPLADWAAFDAVYIRSTWDYVERLPDFLAWAAGVDGVTRLWNPLDVVRWNTDKRYLLDLAGQGHTIVPTAVAEPGGSWSADFDVDDPAGVVVKPAVGASSRGVRHVIGVAAVSAAVDALHASGDVALVQPFLSETDVVGERGLVYVCGEFSHGFEKVATLAPQGDVDILSVFARESIAAREPTAEERSVADAVVGGLGPTAYARIDLLPTPDGPALLELELTEPSLFLGVRPDRAEHVASAFRSLAG